MSVVFLLLQEYKSIANDYHLVRPIDDLPPGRTLMMPTRKRTRAAERAARIAWERGLNEARWAADPPPF